MPFIIEWTFDVKLFLYLSELSCLWSLYGGQTVIVVVAGVHAKVQLLTWIPC